MADNFWNQFEFIPLMALPFLALIGLICVVAVSVD